MSETTTQTLKTLADEQIKAGHLVPEHLNTIQELILKDGTIDDQEVAILNDLINQTRDNTSNEICRTCVEFLFTLNEATLNVQNAETWKNFFIETIAAHVLDDEASAQVIDEEEALWLIGMIESDKQYDPNEIALLEYLNNNAQVMPSSVKFRLGMILALT
ncbi:MAG: hypothetical protein HQL93_09310 [Magnetococcales bacterium]|nr:hypothetical protein [Magnetococcales bacterium]